MFGLLKNKKIVLGVTGGVACYKAVYLLRLLMKAEAIVSVVATENALSFIGRATWESLSKNKLLSDTFAVDSYDKIAHISLAQESDMIIIAPATANTIAKIAHGIADNLLTSIVVAATAPVVIAPAMNSVMYEQHVTQENLHLLQKRGLHIISPESGELACDDVGVGRLEGPDTIITTLAALLGRSADAPRRWLITAGATKEFVDPIRYLTNGSSGLTGLLIAEYAAATGDNVTLIAGSLPRKARFGVTVIPVVSASDMANAVKKYSDTINVFVMSAAVADYSMERHPSKIKKGDGPLLLELERTEDILLHSTRYMNKQIFRVGFAAETENLGEHALLKLKNKSLDLICANLLTPTHNPFGASDNELILFDKNGSHSLPKQGKEGLAKKIVSHIRLSIDGGADE